MRSERQAVFERIYGFRSEALCSIEYLDEPVLARLAHDLGIEWKRRRPWYGWRWALRPCSRVCEGVVLRPDFSCSQARPCDRSASSADGKPKNRRFPLAILSIAAVLEGKEEYAIVDGNLDPQPRYSRYIVAANRVEMLLSP